MEGSRSNRGSEPSAVRCKLPRSLSDIPLELLIIIFQSFLPSISPKSIWRDGACKQYMQAVYSLRLVSNTWKDLLDNTPSFWVVLTSTVPYIVNTTSIARSRNAPLTVHFGRFSTAAMSDLSAGHLSPDWFTTLVGPTRDRWKVVWLQDGFRSFIWKHITSPAPMIETVCLRPGSGYPTSLNLLGGATHNIRYLELFGAKIDWAPHMFHGLKHLGLFSSVGDGMTTDLILGVLANSPDLEYLSIDSTTIQISATSFLHPILLLHLQTIELLFLPGNLVCHFLRHIEAPHCQVVVIQTYSISDTNDSEFLSESIGSFEPLLRDLHKKSGGSNLCAEPGFMEWLSCIAPSYGEHYPSFNIEVESTSFASMLQWIGRVVDSADP